MTIKSLFVFMLMLCCCEVSAARKKQGSARFVGIAPLYEYKFNQDPNPYNRDKRDEDREEKIFKELEAEDRNIQEIYEKNLSELVEHYKEYGETLEVEEEGVLFCRIAYLKVKLKSEIDKINRKESIIEESDIASNMKNILKRFSKKTNKQNILERIARLQVLVEAMKKKNSGTASEDKRYFQIEDNLKVSVNGGELKREDSKKGQKVKGGDLQQKVEELEAQLITKRNELDEAKNQAEISKSLLVRQVTELQQKLSGQQLVDPKAIETLKASLKEKETEIAKKATEIASKDDLIKQGDAKIQEQAQEIQSKNQEIAKKDGEIQKQKREIEQKDKEIAGKNEEIAKLKAEVAKLEAKVVELETKLKAELLKSQSAEKVKPTDGNLKQSADDKTTEPVDRKTTEPAEESTKTKSAESGPKKEQVQAVTNQSDTGSRTVEPPTQNGTTPVFKSILISVNDKKALDGAVKAAESIQTGRVYFISEGEESKGIKIFSFKNGNREEITQHQLVNGYFRIGPSSSSSLMEDGKTYYFTNSGIVAKFTVKYNNIVTGYSFDNIEIILGNEQTRDNKLTFATMFGRFMSAAVAFASGSLSRSYIETVINGLGNTGDNLRESIAANIQNGYKNQFESKSYAASNAASAPLTALGLVNNDRLRYR